MLFVNDSNLELIVMSIHLTILILAYHFIGAMRDRWGLKRPPCSKWGMEMFENHWVRASL